MRHLGEALPGSVKVSAPTSAISLQRSLNLIGSDDDAVYAPGHVEDLEQPANSTGN